jgi:hypothetical protein
LRANHPNALIFVIGPWDSASPGSASTGYTTVKQQIISATADRGGFYFLDPEGLTYSKVDAVHPDDAGHAKLGNWLNAQIRSVIGA